MNDFGIRAKDAKLTIRAYPCPNENLMSRFGLIMLALSVLLALTFQFAHQAPTSSSSAAKECVPTLLKSIGNPETMLKCYSHFFFITANLKGFESQVSKAIALESTDNDACLEFIKAQCGNIETLVETLRADHRQIEALRSSWTPIAANLLGNLRDLKSANLKEISSREAFNCAIVILAFSADADADIIFDTWLGIEKLGNCFVPSQWAEFADWAIYVARSNIFTFPPQLFRPSLFSQKQRIATIQALFGVILKGQVFERNGLFRPVPKSFRSSCIDLNYIFIPLRGCDCDLEAIGKLEESFEHFISCLACAQNLPSKIVLDSVQVLCNIISFSTQHFKLASLSIVCILSNSIVGFLRERSEQPTAGTNCASKAIITAHNASRQLFNAALQKLSIENKGFALSCVVEYKQSKVLSVIFSAADSQFKELQPLLKSLVPSNVNAAQGKISEIFMLVKKLPFCEDSLEPDAEKSYAVLYEQAESLREIDKMLYDTVKNDMRLFERGVPNPSVNSVDRVCAYGEILIKLALIRHSLSNLHERLRNATEAVFMMGNFARVSIAVTISIGAFSNFAFLNSCKAAIRRAMDNCMSRDDVIQLHSAALSYVPTVSIFSAEELNNILALTGYIFADDHTGTYELHVATLLETHLLKGGDNSGECLKSADFLTLRIKSSLCMSVLSKWHDDPRMNTESGRAALKAFVCKMIASNYIPRSAAVMLSALLG